MAESLHVHIRKTIEDFWALRSPYRHLVMAGAIGTGKSTAAASPFLYVSVYLYLMRNPKKFFGLAPSTSIVQAFISFSMDKTWFDTLRYSPTTATVATTIHTNHFHLAPKLYAGYEVEMYQTIENVKMSNGRRENLYYMKLKWAPLPCA